MRVRLDLSYDGSHFRGWARQPGLRTVQGTLEDALARVLRAPDPVRVVVAGRTDAGVHASGQVAHVDVDDELWDAVVRGRRAAEDPERAFAQRLQRAFGAYADLVVRRVRRAPEGFDARFSAVWRRYEYRIADEVAGYDPLQRHRTTVVRSRLDVAAMDEAARSLIGLHDFAAYCKAREGATTIRTLFDYDWRRDEDGVLIAHVRADAFCHSMVRALVGGCVSVGQGRLGADALIGIREGGQRTSAFPVLAARGLTLAEVGYPDDALLAQRAEQTRARRDED